MFDLTKATIETAADKAVKIAEQNRQAAKAVRDKALSEITITTINGSVIQCREQDETRLRRKLKRMKRESSPTTAWIDADNQPTEITQADIEAALEHGEDEVARIFEQYIGATL